MKTKDEVKFIEKDSYERAGKKNSLEKINKAIKVALNSMAKYNNFASMFQTNGDLIKD